MLAMGGFAMWDASLLFCMSDVLMNPLTCILNDHQSEGFARTAHFIPVRDGMGG